jgi:hypothetical protein
MLLLLELGLTIFGIVALIRGKMTLTKKRVVEGTPARLLGILALIPLPLTIIFVLLFGVNKFLQGGTEIDQKEGVLLMGMELFLFLGGFVLVYSIGFAVATDPSKRKKRKRRADDWEDEDQEDDDDRPARKKRRIDRDDEDD